MIWKKVYCFLGHQCSLPYAYLSFITQVHNETCQGKPEWSDHSNGSALILIS